MSEKIKACIVGAGFAGIRCALDLAKNKPENLEIYLISDKPHFEYHAALYRVVTGRSAHEVCIPLKEIFENTDVKIIRDFIRSADLNAKTIFGSNNEYKYDYVVLTVGSETIYFDIPGLKEYSFGFKSIEEALRLKKHIHEVFKRCKHEKPEERLSSAHFMIIGGGTSGVELAGDLLVYTHKLAKQHGLDPSIVTLDLLERASKLLPYFPDDVSNKVEQRLRSLGLNIYLNREVVKSEIEEIFLTDMEVKTKTVIWTAGVTSNSFYKNVEGLEFTKRNKVAVNEYLNPNGYENVYIAGDGADTKYSGMAQTAIYDGSFVAENIKRKLSGKKLNTYVPKLPKYSLPIGPNWAVSVLGVIKLYGKPGWAIRRAADLRFFLSILPSFKAYKAFRSGTILSEDCKVCRAAIEPIF